MGKGDAFLEQNDPTRAIEHFEEGKEIILQMGMDSYTTDRLTANMNFRIARAKTKLPGVDKESAFETVLQHQMHIFELSKDAYGERDCRTLNRGLRLADTLVDLERFDEARPLLESLYRASHQLHGRDHHLTKKIGKMLQKEVLGSATMSSVSPSNEPSSAWLLSITVAFVLAGLGYFFDM
jgi:hypothetical protein